MNRILRIIGRNLASRSLNSLDEKYKYDKEQYEETKMEQDDWANTIPFIPPITHGHVIKVYDGDTITIAAKLPYSESPHYRFSVRLNGIDCPEMKSQNKEEKEIALIAKTEMEKLVLGKNVDLKNITTEKYGRILADVYVNEKYINQVMIEKKLAIKYVGGTKEKQFNWKKYYNSK
jgi:endonuclease YncB( thermonuclease family)